MMVNYEYKDLFWKDSIDKKMKISTDDGKVVITNTELNQQQFELNESLCSDSELRFGSCEASIIKFTVNNIFSEMTGKWIAVTMIVDGHADNPFQIGRYKVFSDIVTADRTKRNIVAYDAMYDILNSDVAAWYNSILPDENSFVTMKQFRESFVRHFGLTEILPEGGLVNDSMIIKKTINIVASEESDTPTSSTSVIGETLSGKDVITAICEINGCFGHIGRDGKFHYIYLPQAIEGLYPSEMLYPDHAPEWMAQAKTGHLYPQDPKSTSIGKGNYIKCQYEDYRTKPITKIQIRQEENDIGKIWPETPKSDKDNCYIIEGNFLVYGKSSDELSVIAKNIYDKITDIIYRPFSADCVGNPCLEVGYPISIPAKYEIVESYILKRILKGIQALRDAYSADGQEKYSEKVNGVHRSIMQLKGKANILTRTIEEMRLEMYSIEDGLNTTISVTAAGIRKDMTDADNGLKTTITETAAGLTADIIAEKNRASGEEQKLSNSISVTAEGLSAEITRAKEKEGELSTSIQANAYGITTKVSKDDYNGGTITSIINQSASEVKIDAEHLELSGNTKITGGYMRIEADSSDNNIIHLSRANGSVYATMGTDGMKAASDTREAIFQYSNITIYNSAGQGAIAQLLDNGKGVSSYGWDSYSDERLKHDIEPMDICERAKFIYEQEPVRFKYNCDEAEHYRHGLIAQKVTKTIGEEDWAICSEIIGFDKKTYLTLNYSELIADLIATAQYQKSQIEDLKKEVSELKERILPYEQSI